MLGKPFEFWIGLLGAALYVFERHRDIPLLRRTMLVATSALLGVALAPDLAALSGYGEAVCVVAITTTGYVALDFVHALIVDRKLLMEFLAGRVKK